ncbi:lantibiotic dehydratase [Streptomyces sp. NPDC047130]|uniref:lantibiotic dehydratase n=1 Tax=Streptomyces sp. NPDC047130 TaxID=3155261 RepID=UPI0033C9FF81
MMSIYRNVGTALLRAATKPLTEVPAWWPDLGDADSCSAWLRVVWSDGQFAAGVRQASPALAQTLDAVCAGEQVRSRAVRRAAASAVRYLLRAVGRPTPFGLFAGVAPAVVGHTLKVRWGSDHRTVMRADADLVHNIVRRLEEMPAIRKRLTVVLNNLTTRRGDHLHVQWGGPMGATVRRTPATDLVERLAARPVIFADLCDALTEAFPGSEPARAERLLESLLEKRFLVSSLRAPMTEPDPLTHVIRELRAAGATETPEAADLLVSLDAARQGISRHNQAPPAAQPVLADEVERALRAVAADARWTTAVDLVLDVEMEVPGRVVRDMERAADVLLRLSRHPDGQGAWNDFQVAFWERYGTGTLVPLKEVVGLVAGLGYPHSYPGSRRPAPRSGVSERDQRLLHLAWKAAATGQEEIVLTGGTVDHLAGGTAKTEAPAHVEMCARIHATDVDALERGDYDLVVTPARSAGTLTSRFTPAATGSGLEGVYRTMPAEIDGAVRAQMSFPGLYPHTESVARIPAYLDHVMPMGEVRASDDPAQIIDVDDLAVTATSSRLHLVSVSRRQVIDPQVFHAMALEKQPPLLARFIAHLVRAFGPRWSGFDWGPAAASLPFLPRVRYRRTVLSPARWLLTRDNVPTEGDWSAALTDWRTTWSCHRPVDLRDDDRTLRLDLDVSAHAELLRQHVDQRGEAVLTEAPPADAFGWIGGHAHEIAIPLASTLPPRPNPLTGPLPLLTNQASAPLLDRPHGRWVCTHLYTHPDQHEEVIRLLPCLAESLGHPPWWFIRYLTPTDTDHLRLRVRAADPEQHGTLADTVWQWAAQLRDQGLISDAVLTSYRPEIGRYGPGSAMEAAERVFAADSRFVAALITAGGSGQAATAVSIVDLALGFLGRDQGLRHLVARRAPSRPVDRSVAAVVRHEVRAGAPAGRGWSPVVAEAWDRRAEALADYRKFLPEELDPAAVLDSLLHMHHNRMRGVDRDDEAVCRQLARQAAVAALAREEHSA